MSDKYEMIALNSLSAYRDAKIERDISAMNAASDKFNDVILRVSVRARSRELERMMGALIDATASEALEVYAKEAAEFGTVKDAFELRAKMISQAQDDLFFPSTANELAKMAGALIALKQSTQLLTNSNGDLAGNFKQDDVVSLIFEALKSKAKLDDLLSELTLLKSKMPE